MTCSIKTQSWWGKKKWIRLMEEVAEMDHFKIEKAVKKISRGVYSINREEACDTN